MVDCSRQAGDGINSEKKMTARALITRQMKDAGAAAVEYWAEWCLPDELAEKVYTAMEMERRGKS